MRALLLVLTIAFGATGCADPPPNVPPRSDAASAHSTDAPRDVPPLPDAPVRDDAIAELVEVLGLVMMSSAAWGDEIDGLRHLPAATEADAQAALESGLAGDALFVPSSCVTRSWSGTTASLVLTGCTLAQTRVPVSGIITVEVALDPSFTLRLEGLLVGGSTLTGVIRLYPIVDDPRLWRLIDVDLAYTSARGSATLSGERFTVDADGDGLGPDGEATGIYAPARLTVDGSPEGDLLVSCHWLGSDCIPSNGSIRFTGGAFVAPLWIQFQESTPRDGRVWVGAWRPIFEPCL